MDFRWRHACARGSAAGGRVGGGYKGKRAVVDVQHGALCTLKQDAFAVADGAVKQHGGITN